MAWQLRGINSIQIQNFTNGVGDNKILANGQVGYITLVFGATTLRVDGIDKTIAELVDDFAISTVTMGVIQNGFAPVCPAIDLSPWICVNNPNAISWTLQPIGLSRTQTTFVSSPGSPQFPTKWNGILNAFVLQMQYHIVIDYTVAPDGGDYNQVIVQLGATTADKRISGNNSLIPAPVNPDFTAFETIDFTDSLEYRILADASGIYTLQSGLRHDRLYQRTGPSAPQMNVSIPAFFKTGYIGGNGG